MGSQDDGLRGMTRFSDNEGNIIWPAWRAELKQRVAFEFGKIGNQIIEGEVKESDVVVGEVTEKINAWYMVSLHGTVICNGNGKQ